MNANQALLANAGAIAGSCLVGAAVVATRSAVDDIEPFGLAFLRYAQGAVVLFGFLAVFSRQELRVDMSELRAFAVLGLLMFAAFPVLFNTALTFTIASRGAVILATMPLWTALLARRFSAERLRVAQALGVVISISGVAVVFAESGIGLDEGGDAILGNLLMLGAALIGGIYAVLAKPVMARSTPVKATAYAMAIGALALLVPALVEGLPRSLADASRNTILLVLYLGIFGGALAFWLFAYSLVRLQPTQALVYVNLNPVVATLLASIVLDEPLTPSFGLGFAMVVAGLLLTNIPIRRMNRPALTRAG